MAQPAKKESRAYRPCLPTGRQTSKYTYSDYLKTPDDKRFELIEGDLMMVPAPNTRHQKISENLSFLLSQFVRSTKIAQVFYAPTDVVLDQHNVVQPDILLILNERQKIITEANIQGAPDLVIEIISPSSTHKDLITKKKLYVKFGVKEYWIVDPQDQIVEVYILEKDKFALHQSLEKKDTLFSPLLPGLKIRLTDIFS